MKQVWTKAANRALIQNVTSGTTDNVELAKMLNKSVAQVYDKRYQLGLIEDNAPRREPRDEVGKNHHHTWTQSDRETLSDMYHANWTDSEIAEAMGRSIDSISTQRKVQRLVRTEIERKGKQIEFAKPIETEEAKITPAEPQVQGYVREFSFAWGLIKYKKQ